MTMTTRHRTIATLLIALTLTACGTASQQTVEYRTIASVKLAVDTALNIWFTDFVATGKATPQQEAQVKAAFQTYTAAAGTAANVLRLSGADAPPLDLTKAVSSLLNLLTQFGVKTGGH